MRQLPGTQYLRVEAVIKGNKFFKNIFIKTKLSMMDKKIQNFKQRQATVFFPPSSSCAGPLFPHMGFLQVPPAELLSSRGARASQ